MCPSSTSQMPVSQLQSGNPRPRNHRRPDSNPAIRGSQPDLRQTLLPHRLRTQSQFPRRFHFQRGFQWKPPAGLPQRPGHPARGSAAIRGPESAAESVWLPHIRPNSPGNSDPVGLPPSLHQNRQTVPIRQGQLQIRPWSDPDQY